jgi:hypothetical protein
MTKLFSFIAGVIDTDDTYKYFREFCKHLFEMAPVGYYSGLWRKLIREI